MSTQQWHRTLTFMALFLGLAWFAMGFSPDQSMATDGFTDYFPPPTQHEINSVLRHVKHNKNTPNSAQAQQLSLNDR